MGLNTCYLIIPQNSKQWSKSSSISSFIRRCISWMKFVLFRNLLKMGLTYNLPLLKLTITINYNVCLVVMHYLIYYIFYSHYILFGRRILLDTGDASVPEYIYNLSKVLKEENCDIEQIVLTHWHHDHIGGLSDVLGVTGSGNHHS